MEAQSDLVHHKQLSNNQTDYICPIADKNYCLSCHYQAKD